MTTDPTRPKKDFRVGSVRATIWANPRTTRTGESFVSHTIRLERTYRDPLGEFQKTDSLEVNDVPKAIIALRKAYEHLMTRSDSEGPVRAVSPENLLPRRIP